MMLSHSRIPRARAYRGALPRDPFSVVRGLHTEMDRIFSAVLDAPRPQRPGVAFARVNLWSDDSSAFVFAELPGLSAEQISVEVVGNAVTISGTRSAISAGEGDTMTHEERFAGEFRRQIKLPFEADSSRVAASYENGMLTVNIPRAEATKPRKITVKG